MAETKNPTTKSIKIPNNLDYFGILKNAFNMVRHNRYLWYLGILAGGGFGSGFNGGTGGNPSDFFQQNQKNSASAASNTPPSSDIDLWGEVLSWMQNNWGLIIIIAFIILALIVIFTILSSMAKAGLIAAVDSLSKGEESSFGKAMRFGWHKWWRVFGAGFLIGLVVFAVFLVMAVPVVALWFVAPIIAILAALIAIPIFFFVAIISGVVFEYALRYISLKESRAVASIKNGFELMKTAKKETLFIWLITVGVAMVSGLVILIAILLIGLILVLLGLLFFILSSVGGIIYACIAITAFIVALFIVGGFISSLISAYWTLCFKELETT